MSAPSPLPEAAPLTWHVAQVRARAEYGISRRLRELGHATYWPHRHVQRRHARRVGERMEGLIPGYVFFALRPGQGLMAVNDCWGVIAVLHAAGPDGRGAPYVLDPAVIAELREDTDEDGCMGRLTLAAAKARARLPAGLWVRIAEGVFAGHYAVVTADDGRLVQVEGTVFGRVVPIRLDASALEPVDGPLTT